MHASDLIQHEDTSGTTRETSHQCYIMRKAMSKEVGAGGRFDIFLDSDAIFDLQECFPFEKNTILHLHSNSLAITMNQR